jgi:hypothetical protein
MRMTDIGSRVAVFTSVSPTAVAAGTSTIFSAGTDATSNTLNHAIAIDRTDFNAYMVHISVRYGGDAQSETLTITSKLQSSSSITTPTTFTAGVADVTSVTTTDANYKQFFMNTTGATATSNNLAPLAGVAGGQFKAQPYVFTAAADITLYPAILDLRYWGSLRDANVKQYIAPWITVADNEDAGVITWISAELILGGATHMPVMEGGTSGTSGYMSKGV